MERLIDAMKTVTNLSGRITPLIKMGENPMRVYQEVLQVIAEAPSVDAVEVVRCRDCKHWDSETWFCDNHSTFWHHGLDWNMFSEDDFCSYGERKDGYGNG